VSIDELFRYPCSMIGFALGNYRICLYFYRDDLLSLPGPYGKEIASSYLGTVSPMAVHHVIPNRTYHVQAKRGGYKKWDSLTITAPLVLHSLFN
jgi:hypothetical protein